MPQRFTRSRITWIAYILLAFYGYFLNILGPITPFIHQEFHLSYTVSSLHFSAFAIGILVVGLAGHYVIRRIGRQKALAIGAIGLGSGALLLVFGREPYATVSATLWMGSIGSLILAVVPATLAEEHGELRAVAISEANVLASLVSAAAPLLVGAFASLIIGWRSALVIAAILSILVGVLLIKPDQDRTDHADHTKTRQKLPAKFWYFWIILVLCVAVEFCMIFWCADFMEKELGLTKTSAAQAVSLFLAGMIIGRIASSRLLRRFSAKSLVFVSIGVGLAGFMIFWNAVHPYAGMAGLLFSGLGVAGLYPMVLSISIGASGGNETQAGARTTLASGTAILVLPLVLGRLADITNLKAAYSVVAIIFGIILLLMILANKVAKDPAPADYFHKTPSSAR